MPIYVTLGRCSALSPLCAYSLNALRHAQMRLAELKGRTTSADLSPGVMSSVDSGRRRIEAAEQRAQARLQQQQLQQQQQQAEEADYPAFASRLITDDINDLKHGSSALLAAVAEEGRAAGSTVRLVRQPPTLPPPLPSPQVPLVSTAFVAKALPLPFCFWHYHG